jgi:splicing factor 45
MVELGSVDADLKEDITEECRKFGPVERCVIFEDTRPNVPADEAVRVFVKFSYSADAANAKRELDGRSFGGRVVRCVNYDPILLDENVFIG